MDLLDVDRVEVFRGSQVTRFGRYAEAGAIRITTRRPGQQVGGHASVRYGDFDTQVYQGAASGPLGRAAAFSLSGLESKRDGYIENRFLHTTLDDREQFAGRANLFLLPLSGLEIAFTGEADHAGEGPKALTLLDQPDPFEVRYDTRGHLRTDEYPGSPTPHPCGVSSRSRRDALSRPSGARSISTSRLATWRWAGTTTVP